VKRKKRNLSSPDAIHLPSADSMGSMDWPAWAFDRTDIMDSILHPEEAGSQFGGTMNSMIRGFGYTRKYVRKA
jgi:hypothetical protein